MDILQLIVSTVQYTQWSGYTAVNSQYSTHSGVDILQLIVSTVQYTQWRGILTVPQSGNVAVGQRNPNWSDLSKWTTYTHIQLHTHIHTYTYSSIPIPHIYTYSSIPTYIHTHTTHTVGRFLNAWLNVCVSGKKGKLRVYFLRLHVALRGLHVAHSFIALF